MREFEFFFDRTVKFTLLLNTAVPKKKERKKKKCVAISPDTTRTARPTSYLLFDVSNSTETHSWTAEKTTTKHAAAPSHRWVHSRARILCAASLLFPLLTLTVSSPLGVLKCVAGCSCRAQVPTQAHANAAVARTQSSSVRLVYVRLCVRR